MDRFRHLRARFYYTALDAVYTGSTRPDGPRKQLLRKAVTARGNFDRIGSFARYLESAAPRMAAWLRRAIEDTRALPIRETRVAPRAFGTRTSCLTLPGRPRRVLKVLRPSIGCDVRAAMRLSREARDFYETLARWYSGIPGLLPHTVHLVVRGPIRGAVAAVQIQEMMPDEARDLLGDHSDDELVSLLLEYPRLHRDFRHFVSGTLYAWHEEGRFLDMVGRDNVLLLPGPDGPELRVPDFGIWDITWRRDTHPALYARAVAAVERIQRILHRADAARGRSEGAEAHDVSGRSDHASGAGVSPREEESLGAGRAVRS